VGILRDHDGDLNEPGEEDRRETTRRQPTAQRRWSAIHSASFGPAGVVSAITDNLPAPGFSHSAGVTPIGEDSETVATAVQAAMTIQASGGGHPSCRWRISPLGRASYEGMHFTTSTKIRSFEIVPGAAEHPEERGESADCRSEGVGLQKWPNMMPITANGISPMRMSSVIVAHCRASSLTRARTGQVEDDEREEDHRVPAENLRAEIRARPQRGDAELTCPADLSLAEMRAPEEMIAPWRPARHPVMK